MLDLDHATRDELIRIIHVQADALATRDDRIATLETALAQQQAVIVQLTAQVGTLLANQADTDDEPPRGTPSGMPGLKPQQAPVREACPRKRRTKGAGRSRMTATTKVVHALAACPACGAPLAGGGIKRTREVIDVPVPQIVVTEHIYLERRCPDCGKRCVPAPVTDNVVLGQSRLGHGLVSLIAVLREAARLPFATIQSLLATLTGLHLSIGALVAAVRRLADRATATVAGIGDAIRASPVVHADETGWRQAGRNGYVWTFSTPTQRLFVHGNRAKAMLTQGLGNAYAGIVVSDFYGVYTQHDGLHQYCWAHLLRDIHELTDAHPEDAAVQGWAAAVVAIFHRAQTGATGDRAARRHVRHQAEADLKQVWHTLASAEGRADAPLHPHPPASGKSVCLRHRSKRSRDQQCRRAQPATAGDQPEDQWRDAVSARHDDQNDPCLAVRHLARPRDQPLPRLPGSARVPPSLNSYVRD